MVLDCGTDEEKVEVDEVEEDPWWFKFTVDGKFNTLNKKKLKSKSNRAFRANKNYGSWKFNFIQQNLTLEVNRYRVDHPLANRLT